ncbi:MAG: efflux RND transporter periplasmic adaptor subunit [Planctomycetes bacterium]|nr:efflux RND transporter periplasmic adaptor subunit [Planctomycetota bacterium]
MKFSTIVLLALGVAVVGGITWAAMKPKAPTMVTVTKVERIPKLEAKVKATGKIRAQEFVDIQAEVAGVIVELLVEEGAHVAAGDVLLRLDDTQLQAEVASARAQVAAALADVANADVGVTYAEANLATQKVALASVKVEREQADISRERAEASYRRKEELFQEGLIGSEEFEVAAAEARLAKQRFDLQQARLEQAEAQCKSMETQIEAAKTTRQRIDSQVAVARAGLARAEDMLAKTVIKSPLGGLITACNVEKGERAVPGIQSNPIATLMTIADMSVIEAEIEVSEADIVSVRLGQVAVVEVDAIRDLEMKGVVTEIGQSPIQSTDNQEGNEFKVVVRLENPPETLRPGFIATADIVTDTRESCLVVPLGVVVAREVELDAEGAYQPPPKPAAGEVMAADDGSSRRDKKELEGVFVIADGFARFRPVKTGIAGGADFELLEGLADGEQVISGPHDKLRTLAEWDRVEIDPKRQRAWQAPRR